MQEPIASAKTPSGRRRAKLLAGTLALTMASFGAAVAISAAPAWATVTTNSYTIGTPGIGVHRRVGHADCGDVGRSRRPT